MGTIQRAVVLDAFKVFVATAAVALLLMTLGGGAKEGVSRGLPPQIILRIMPYLIPEMLRFVVPGCLLFAVCSVYGRMAASNEVVAIKSIGVNPLRVMWPALVLAYALSMFTYWLYDVCAVWARPNLQREVAQSLTEIAYGYLRANRSFRTQGLSIVVKGVEGDQLQKPVVTIESGAAGRPVVLIADRARLKSDPRRVSCASNARTAAWRSRAKAV